jgi:hypothetical protein
VQRRLAAGERVLALLQVHLRFADGELAFTLIQCGRRVGPFVGGFLTAACGQQRGRQCGGNAGGARELRDIQARISCGTVKGASLRQ